MVEIIMMMVLFILPATLVIWLVFVVIMIIYRILTRKIAFNKLAQKFNIELRQADVDNELAPTINVNGSGSYLFNLNKNYVLSGNYLGRNVYIEEYKIAKSIDGLMSSDPITKKLIIKIDNKIILDQKCVIFISEKEIKGVVDKYIQDGVIMKRFKSKLEIYCYYLLFFMIICVLVFRNFIINLFK